MPTSTRFWSELAWLGGERPTPGVAITVEDDRITAVDTDTAPAPDDVRLNGLTLPGLANGHSHAFHRALRGRTGDGGSFWSWREIMYRAADRLDPDGYHRLARAVFAEMAEAGYTVVGEFHYLHHDHGGAAYADPNAMGEAVVAAASDVGLRITLLDTLYLWGGIDASGGYEELDDVQRRFGDDTVDAWLTRVDEFTAGPRARIGAAVHSARAVDPPAMARAAEWASEQSAVVHAHVSEQTAENDRVALAHGATPTELMAQAGLVNDRFTAVHATHLTDGDIALLGSSGATVCLCPTTERDLADGIGPSMPLAAAGVSLSIGSDSQAVVDPFEEIRGVEMHARLVSHRRGNHAVPELLEMGSAAGYRSLGWPDGGRIEVGALADLTMVRMDSARLAGTPPTDATSSAVLAATASDVDTVVVGGAVVVSEGRHRTIDTARALSDVLAG